MSKKTYYSEAEGTELSLPSSKGEWVYIVFKDGKYEADDELVQAHLDIQAAGPGPISEKGPTKAKEK